MQNESIGFSVALPNPAGGPPVDVRFSGSAQVQAWAPDPHVAARATAALQQAVHMIVSGKLARNELALPTLAMSMPHLAPAIVAQANTQLQPQGLALAAIALDASVPQHAIAPAAAAIAAAPTPLQSVASNFTSNVAGAVASSVPTGVQANIGGFKVRVGAGGVDGDHLANQVMGEAKDKLIGCVIVGGVVAVLGLATMFVLVKVILFG